MNKNDETKRDSTILTVGDKQNIIFALFQFIYPTFLNNNNKSNHIIIFKSLLKEDNEKKLKKVIPFSRKSNNFQDSILNMGAFFSSDKAI